MDVIEPEVIIRPEPLIAGDGPFRPNVAGLLVRNKGTQILLGERIDTPACWQWPQGGLDPGEAPEDGLRRELAEEIGVSELEIVYRFPFRLRYRFPRSLAARFDTIGQEQTFFVVESEQTPDLRRATHHEFGELKWVSTDQVLATAVWFKKEVYRHALAHFEQERPVLPFKS